MKYLVITAFMIGCASQAEPEPVAFAAATLSVIESYCADEAKAEAFRDMEAIFGWAPVDAWLEAGVCQAKRPLWFCNDAYALPQVCTQIGGGVPTGTTLGCCGSTPTPCSTTVDCPVPASDCYRAVCLKEGPVGQCLYEPASFGEACNGGTCQYEHPGRADSPIVCR